MMGDPLETLDLMAWRCECGARMQSTTQLLKTGEKWVTCEGMHKTMLKPQIRLMPRNPSTGEYLLDAIAEGQQSSDRDYSPEMKRWKAALETDQALAMPDESPLFCQKPSSTKEVFSTTEEDAT